MTLAVVGHAPVSRVDLWRALDRLAPRRVLVGVGGEVREWVWSWCGMAGVPWEPLEGRRDWRQRLDLREVARG